MVPESRDMLVIGLAEYVDFPAWNIRNLRAKVDTGARTSALHVENIQDLGHGRVSFDVRLHRKRVDRRVTIEAPVLRRARVRTSSGHTEARIFVVTSVKIGPVVREIELSLVDRGSMIFRMLIGRSALAHRFLVDVTRRFALKPKKRLRAPRQTRLAKR